MTTEGLQSLPLFRDMSADQVATFRNVLEVEEVPAGETIFRTGAMPNRFLVVARGDVSLLDGAEERFRVRAMATLGELGTLTGIPRSVNAVTATSVELWSCDTLTLSAFLEREPAVALPFYRSILKMTSEKVCRDRRRIDELRANTPGANRRVRGRAAPTTSMPAMVRMGEGGMALPVLDFSDGYMKVVGTGDGFGDGMPLAGTLVLPTAEIPFGGVVERAARDGAVVKLSPLPDDTRAVLDDYVTRLFMLDFVV